MRDVPSDHSAGSSLRAIESHVRPSARPSVRLSAHVSSKREREREKETNTVLCIRSEWLLEHKQKKVRFVSRLAALSRRSRRSRLKRKRKERRPRVLILWRSALDSTRTGRPGNLAR